MHKLGGDFIILLITYFTNVVKKFCNFGNYFNIVYIIQQNNKIKFDYKQ